MPTRNAVVRQISGLTFASKADTNHWVIMDGSVQAGGSGAGSSPKELLLMSLGGCTGSDIVSILKKKRVPVEGLEIHLKGEAREEHPQIFTEIHIEYVVFGDNVNKVDVERAIELSTTKYCSVSAMLSGVVKMTHSCRIEPSPTRQLEKVMATAL